MRKQRAPNDMHVGAWAVRERSIALWRLRSTLLLNPLILAASFVRRTTVAPRATTKKQTRPAMMPRIGHLSPTRLEYKSMAQ
ncbi:hypothetical protein PMAYCL1PPCAC_22084 [Pristionchus mayeri]|uniref:Uncharacterized protein n=1 Tax=Pristionchus mayeri TaxID=1317129 RepID=A0AAN5CWK5_9BILA|nr:hypothetical protein PMAYCL1PPCAC_22082 [Pristionchus mayeri]GMR51889.1 hypothetical protein PMAYCL1PPCAC_22084 [Pristionchus mayeri]